MSTLHVDTQAQLEALPDGTIISWLRIPGDETSRALAFVRVEVVTDQSFAYDVGERIVWISPGGWAPQTPESAEITYPVEVIRLGEFRPEGLVAEQMRAEYFTAMANAVDVPPPATFDLLHGGTWARETALKAAVRVFQGLGLTPGYTTEEFAALVTSTSEVFEAHLNRAVDVDVKEDDSTSSTDSAPSEPRVWETWKDIPYGTWVRDKDGDRWRRGYNDCPPSWAPFIETDGD